MADFKAITTQDEFDAAIKDRLERAERKIREEYKGWTSPDDLKKLADTHKSEIDSINTAHSKELEKYAGYDEKFSAQEHRIHELEVSGLKTKIASDMKLPLDAVEFLQGEDEKSIQESAEKLSKLSNTHPSGYVRNTERDTGDAKDKVWRDFASQLPGRHD